MSGCGAVWLARYLGVVEVAGSSPVTPTIFSIPLLFYKQYNELAKYNTVTTMLLCFIEV